MPKYEHIDKRSPVFIPGTGDVVTYYTTTEDGNLQMLAQKPDGSTSVVLTSIRKEPAPEIPQRVVPVIRTDKNKFDVKFYMQRTPTGVTGYTKDLNLRDYVHVYNNADDPNDSCLWFDFYAGHRNDLKPAVHLYSTNTGILEFDDTKFYGTAAYCIVSYPGASSLTLLFSIHRDYTYYV